MATMVLERKTLPRSLSSFFAVSRIAAIPRDDGVLLTAAPETENTPKPVFGCAKGQFRMAADFDAPLDCFTTKTHSTEF